MKTQIFCLLIFTILSACNIEPRERRNRNLSSSLPLVDMKVDIDKIKLELDFTGNRLLTWETNNYSNIDPIELANLRLKMDQLSLQLISNATNMEVYQRRLQDYLGKIERAEARQKEILEGQIAQYHQKIRELVKIYDTDLNEGDRRRASKKECPCFQRAYEAMENAIKYYQDQPESIKLVVPKRVEEFQRNKERVIKMGKQQMNTKNYRECFSKYNENL